MNNDLSLAAHARKESCCMDGRICPLPGKIDLSFNLETAAGPVSIKLMGGDCDAAFVEGFHGMRKPRRPGKIYP